MFLMHSRLGMVIYYRLTLVVLTHCFAKPTGGSLQTVYLYYGRIGAEADIKL